MALTVVGVFDSTSDAQDAVEALVSDGFSRNSIDLSTARDDSYTDGNYASNTGDTFPNRHQNTSGTVAEEVVDDTRDVTSRVGNSIPDRHRNTSGTAAEEVVDDTKDVGSSIGNFFSSLFGGNDDADRYSRVAERSSIVTVHVQSEDEAERAADILDDNGAVDVDEKDAQFSNSYTGPTDYSGASTVGNGLGVADPTLTTGRVSDDVVRDGETLSVPVIEENLRVGKETVETGGVRVRSRIVERPVEENVRLRTERVVVQRNPVDRAATDADFTAFKEGEVELTEHAERAVVAKEARVVEEVTVGKTVDEHDEAIHDTVRRTDVEVDQLNPTSTDTYRTTDANTSDLNTTHRDNDVRTL
ncbi:YsnF/AvaK domain-containing protein [Fibrella sp. ES10-3-2-2]|nr:hypothetical protein A6C57_02940 [Fibrella sp. ES10-3-2-2]